MPISLVTKTSLKLLIIAGARPNFMKVAPLIKAAEAHNRAPGKGTSLDCRLIHTGQHYDEKMSEVFFEELGIPAPQVNLGVGSGSHAIQTANIMTKFEPVCLEQQPDWVVVVGDVNSTMGCTLVCSKLGIKVAHVEAGLRSFDRTMPEEVNRIVTDALADLLLTPSHDANENLHKEGVSASRIGLVGNVMIDAVVANLQKARASRILAKLGTASKNFVYVTLHRPSNVDDRDSLASIMRELKRLAAQVAVVFPIHPRTRKMCQNFGISLDDEPGLKIIEPIGYHDSLCLTENARLVLTDSGGLQEESTYFRTPCLTLRPNTERPVTITLGSNKLTEVGHLAKDFADALNRQADTSRIPPLWDGHAADRIIAALIAASGAVQQPIEGCFASSLGGGGKGESTTGLMKSSLAC
jgi:UDP-N-acetylglucosamine 2-epimerase (non-hydrolysing)